MNQRNGTLDLLKFICSVLMVLFHSYKFAESRKVAFFHGGALLVEFFFIVSGVLLAASADRQTAALGGDAPDVQTLASDTLRFMKRKFLSLCPNYYVAWILSFLVLHINHTGRIIGDLSQSVWSLLLISETGLSSYNCNAVTWYIGAMLLVMLALYPILRRYRNLWYYVIAPLLWIFLMGYSNQTFKNLSAPHAWMGWYYKGMYRAVMDITLGTMCFKLSQGLAGISFTKTGRNLLSLVSAACFARTIGYLWGHGSGKQDWTIAFLFAVTITITFSNAGSLSRVLVHPILNWLGSFSYSLYLSHYCWCKTMAEFLPGRTYLQMLPVYLTLTFVTALFIHFFSGWLRKLWQEKGPAITRCFIAPKNE